VILLELGLKSATQRDLVKLHFRIRNHMILDAFQRKVILALAAKQDQMAKELSAAPVNAVDGTTVLMEVRLKSVTQRD